MLAELRQARYGYLLAVPLLLLCAAGRTPTESAAVLFCSRSSIYRVVKAYRAGSLSWEAEAEGVCDPRDGSLSCRRSSNAPCWPFSRPFRTPVGGVGPVGVVRRWPWSCEPAGA
jgi:Homeodomain-like domain